MMIIESATSGHCAVVPARTFLELAGSRDASGSLSSASFFTSQKMIAVTSGGMRLIVGEQESCPGIAELLAPHIVVVAGL
jgi:hypothetical protein